ncbi:MAG: hypothetical protein PHT75_01405 [Bacilli bacterium]|nr:hypothetical protein [Bacilli bacterium]MDD3304772.1 hypothetical protein [Bacilli bacterium]MDD4053794.1 hypothetical protein [Bacilli bacterium]MDD4411632.1 hypothetical protein [Bacilli bacterium]
MFKSITKEQYEEIVELSKVIRLKNVEVKPGSPNDLTRERDNVEKAYKQYSSFFEKNLFTKNQDNKSIIKYNPEEAKKIFELNLLFRDNNLFYEQLKTNFFIEFMHDDMDKLKEYFQSDQPGIKSRCDRIITNLSKGYYINEQIIREKVEEITTYMRVYEPKQFRRVS